MTTLAPPLCARTSPFVALHRPDDAAPAALVEGGLNILDLSCAPRLRTVLAPADPAVSLPVPGAALRGRHGWLVARLSAGGVIALPSPTQAPLSVQARGDEAAWPIAPGPACDPGFAHGYWLYCVGASAPALFRHGCETDMRPGCFGDLSVCQTRLFATSVLVLREDWGGRPGYHLLGCGSYAQHMEKTMQNLMARYGGAVLTPGQLAMDGAEPLAQF
ncbi:hypothetical protein MTR62_08215 [Novosphingobium sp. 1949]|uniref:Sarcosine oxidase subunit gamma n=1 Tax=Novosphingobium organovorum TaxID=2930092 RepID=A0ABT0BCC1_9SPHN|nr:hypothetical protein [Novosphingobium organovorum]MCJ2182672.1 hypothetical protein [Novosphingobium organovorum]